MRDESEKEVVHRIEAFSDIVIGFSLAQLGLNLTIPAHARDLFTHVHGATSLFALFVTFALVCVVWWHHHRIFRHLFIPTRFNIFANFAALCGVILLAYSMQILVHAHMVDNVALAMYTGSFGWIMAFFAYIAWSGLRARGSGMSANVRTESHKTAIRDTVVSIWMLVFTVVVLVFGMRGQVAAWTEAGLVLSLALVRFLSRRRRLSGSSSSPSV